MPFVMEEVSRGWRPLRVVPEFVFSSFLFFLAEFFFTFPGRKNVNRRVAFSLSLSLFFISLRADRNKPPPNLGETRYQSKKKKKVEKKR